MNHYRSAVFKSGDEDAIRSFLDNPPDHSVFYRKMSQAEFDAGYVRSSGKFDFDAYFEYTNTEHHRLWMSTSLDKCRLFSNANATKDTDVIVRFVFSQSPAKFFAVRAHQEKGVQHEPEVVAVHREGFAQVGNMKDDDIKGLLARSKRAYNLGFTSQQSDDLCRILERVEVVSGPVAAAAGGAGAAAAAKAPAGHGSSSSSSSSSGGGRKGVR